MADNTTLNAGSGGDVIATDDIGGVKYQRVKVAYGDDGSATDASATNPLPVKMQALAYATSTGNNSTTNLAAGASFTGTIETIQNLQAAQISVTCNQPYTVTVKQYLDSGGTLLVSTDTFTQLGGVPLNENVSLPGDYFNVTVTNNGQATTTTFQVGVTFGIMATGPRTLSNFGGLPVSINDVKGQKNWRTTFASVIAAGWDTAFWNEICVGSGMARSQSAGNGVITTGTTVNSETIMRSKEAFDGNMICRAQVTLSQRIANNSFFIELVDVIGDGLAATASSATALAVTIPNNPFTSANVGQSMYIGNLAGGLVGVPNRYTIASVSGTTVNFTVAGFTAGSGTVSLWGWNYSHVLYDGVTATNAKYDTQRRGWNTGDSTITINTTVTPGHMVIQAMEDGKCAVADMLVATSTLTTLTVRGSRAVNLPEEQTTLYLQIRALNGSTAPASTTTFTLGTVGVEEYTPIQTTLNALKPMSIEEAMPVNIIRSDAVPSVIISSGTVTLITAANLNFPTQINDIVSAALTTTTTTATIVPTYGSDYEVNIPVTAVSGTSPTLDVVIQESDDTGTNWYDVWHFERITATGMYRSPKLTMKGNRIRYVQTVAGTTPSFTRAIIRNQGSTPGRLMRRIIDRAIAVNTLNSVTSSVQAMECRGVQVVVVMGAITTTAPQFKIQGSDDNGATWYDLSPSALTSVANSTVQQTVNNVNAQLVRAIVSTAGSGATLTQLILKTFD